MKSDNVTFIGPRARYLVLGVQPTLLVHTMAAGSLDGARPATAATPSPDNTDPTVSGGKALWGNLTHGGLFNFTKKSVVVEALSSGTWLIVEETTPNTYAVTRATPTTFPFKLSPDEKLQVTGVSTATVLARLDVQRCI